MAHVIPPVSILPEIHQTEIHLDIRALDAESSPA